MSTSPLPPPPTTTTTTINDEQTTMSTTTNKPNTNNTNHKYQPTKSGGTLYLGEQSQGVLSSSLYDAIKSGNFTYAMQILENIGSREPKQLLLHTALVKKEWAMVNTLLDNRVGIMDVSPDKRITALYTAIQVNASPIIIKRMLSLPVPEMNPNFRSITNSTTLHVAAEQNVSPVLVDLLCKYGGDPNVLDIRGRTPLFVGAKAAFSPQLAYSLLRGGADVHKTITKQNIQALHMAVQNKAPVGTVRVMMEYSVNVDFQFLVDLTQIALHWKVEHLYSLFEHYAQRFMHRIPIIRMDEDSPEKKGGIVPSLTYGLISLFDGDVPSPVLQAAAAAASMTNAGDTITNYKADDPNYGVAIERRICWNCVKVSENPLPVICFTCGRASYCNDNCYEAHSVAHGYVCGGGVG
jgi:hypothetical protein